MVHAIYSSHANHNYGDPHTNIYDIELFLKKKESILDAMSRPGKSKGASLQKVTNIKVTVAISIPYIS